MKGGAVNEASLGVKEKQYTFDHVFEEFVDTEVVFDQTTRFLIPKVTDGYNATVFAYGATGAGKTHTMLGRIGQQGVIGFTFEALFDQILEERKQKDFSVRMSFIEIYNEELKDLLNDDTDKPNVEIREDPNKGIYLSGVKELECNSTEDILNLLHTGNYNRTTEATDANEQSS